MGSDTHTAGAAMVSLFPAGIKQTTGGQLVPVAQAIEGIRTGTWRAQVEAVQAAALDKKQLPYFTPSGTFRERTATGLQERSNLICLDIDHRTDCRAAIVADPYTLAVFKSASGTGLAVLIPTAPGADHGSTFDALKTYYKQRHGIEIDRSCRDICRARFVSYDPGLYHNPEAATFQHRTHWKPDLEATIMAIESAAINLTANYNEWLKLGMALASECGESGRDYFHQLSAMDDRYDRAECDRKYDNCLKKGRGTVTIASLYHFCKQVGISPVRSMELELEQMVRQQKRNGKASQPLAAEIQAARGLEPALVYPLVERIYSEKTQTIEGFWWVDYDQKKERKILTIPSGRFIKFLSDAGFCRHRVGTGVTFVHLSNRVVKEVQRDEIKQYVTDYLAELPFEFYGRSAEDGELPEMYQLWRAEVQDKVIQLHRSLFDTGHLEWLPLLEGHFLRDTATAAYFYFQNGWVHVVSAGAGTRGHYLLRPYTELPGLIWQEQICTRDFAPLTEDETGSEGNNFYRFCFNVCGQDPERLSSLLTILGYLLHEYKSRSEIAMPWLVDETIGSGANGRTGKSLLIRSTFQLRNGVTINGRARNLFDSQFLYSEITPATRIAMIDDCHHDIEPLFSILSEGVQQERKGKDKVTIPYQLAPKFAGTSNKVPVGIGPSHQARLVEFEVAPHYAWPNNPVQEFGREMFEDWPAGDPQWSLFDNFMMLCVVEFFEAGGMRRPAAVNLMRRKLIESTSEEFAVYMDDLLRDATGSWCRLGEVIAKQDIRAGVPDLSDKLFAKWLRSYAEFSGLTVTETRQRAGTLNPVACVIFTRKVVPVVPDK